MKQEERRKYQLEIQKTKETFLQREKETTDDLMNLEQLHSHHINKLVISPLLSFCLFNFLS